MKKQTNRKLAADRGTKYRNLSSFNLHPGCVVTNDCDNRYPVSLECIKLCYSVTQGTVPIDDPDLRLRTAKLGPEGEATTDTESTESTGVQPVQRSAGSNRKN